MTRIERGVRILSGAVLCLALAGTGPVVAGDDSDHKGRMKWVEVDADGNRHEETIEFDGARPFLGVQLERGRDGGARVDSVVEESPAESAGLREGDVILRYDGVDIDTPWDLTRAVLKSQPGERVRIEVERDGTRETLTAEVGENEDWVGAFAYGGDGHVMIDSEIFGGRMKQLHSEKFQQHMEKLGERLGEMRFDFHTQFDDFSDGRNFRFRFGKPRLGVELVQVTGDLREHLGARSDEGVLVGRVIEDSAAESAGVSVGDLIVAVGGETVENQGDLVRLLAERDGETFNLDVIRDGRPLSLTVSLPDRDEETFEPGKFWRHRNQDTDEDRT